VALALAAFGIAGAAEPGTGPAAGAAQAPPPRTVVVAGVGPSGVAGALAEGGLAAAVERLRQAAYVIREHSHGVIAYSPQLWPEERMAQALAALGDLVRRPPEDGLPVLERAGPEEANLRHRLSQYWEKTYGFVLAEDTALAMSTWLRVGLEAEGRKATLIISWPEMPPEVRERLRANPLRPSAKPAGERARMVAYDPLASGLEPLRRLTTAVHGEGANDPGRRAAWVGLGMSVLADEIAAFRAKHAEAKRKLVEAFVPREHRALVARAGEGAPFRELPEELRSAIETRLLGAARVFGFRSEEEAREFLRRNPAVALTHSLGLSAALPAAEEGAPRYLGLPIPQP
jgi:hypothetical protein